MKRQSIGQIEQQKKPKKYETKEGKCHQQIDTKKKSER